MNALRSHAWLTICCTSVSGFSTTPMSRLATTSRKYSPRVGGAASRRSAVCMSVMGDDLLLLDATGKKQIVNAVRQLASARRIDRVAAIAVELALDLAGMRREQQDAVADQHRLGNRVGDEQHGEARVGPQREELLLHLAPGERV